MFSCSRNNAQKEKGTTYMFSKHGSYRVVKIKNQTQGLSRRQECRREPNRLQSGP